MTDQDELFTKVFDLSVDIRYIALYDKDYLIIKQRDDIKNVSSGESDKYEELLVNPTLIKLASQRGNIDCGGLEYFIIKYGNFFVLLIPTRNGHINIGIEPTSNPCLLLSPLNEVLKMYYLTV